MDLTEDLNEVQEILNKTAERQKQINQEIKILPESTEMTTLASKSEPSSMDIFIFK